MINSVFKHVADAVVQALTAIIYCMLIKLHRTNLTETITAGNFKQKARLDKNKSTHPTTTSNEIKLICESIKVLAQNFKEWGKDYNYSSHTNKNI